MRSLSTDPYVCLQRFTSINNSFLEQTDIAVSFATVIDLPYDNVSGQLSSCSDITTTILPPFDHGPLRRCWELFASIYISSSVKRMHCLRSTARNVTNTNIYSSQQTITYSSKTAIFSDFVSSHQSAHTQHTM